MESDSVSVENRKLAIFAFEPADYTAMYRERGFALIPQGVTPEFIRYAIHYASKLESSPGDASLNEPLDQGGKRQFLMEFPDSTNYPEEIYETIASLAGLEASRMMLSERHVKFYDRKNAPKNPAPRKDRLASSICVGIALNCPGESRLVLYPDHENALNVYSSSAEWRQHLDKDELPERVLEDIEPVEIAMETGDVVVFSGNTIYHERISPGASSIIYLKLNDLRLDPSCEDPHTAPMRARSIRLLEDSSDEELLGLRTLLSPRLEGITCRYTRHHWMEVMEGRVAGEETFGLCEIEWKILRLLDDRIDEVRSLIARAGFPAHRAREYASMIRRLVQVGALELHTV